MNICMASWAEPRFVCEVEFRDWTHDGLIRQASFKGLREDKLPDDISLEAPRRSKSRTYTGPVSGSHIPKGFFGRSRASPTRTGGFLRRYCRLDSSTCHWTGLES